MQSVEDHGKPSSKSTSGGRNFRPKSCHERLMKSNTDKSLAPDDESPSGSGSSAVRQKSVFTSGQTKFNPAAPPFVSQARAQLRPKTAEQIIRSFDLNNQDIPISRIGPTQLPVNGRIWNAIAARPSRSTEESIYCSYFNQNATVDTESSHDVSDCARQFGPVPMLNGTIQIRLREGIRVDMTVDKSIRVINPKGHIVAAMSGNCSTASLSHPNGQVFQHGVSVDIVAYDGMKRNNFVRYARMYEKGVSLTSEKCALIYLVDDAGTRTTSDAMTMDINHDYSIPVFLTNSRKGPMCVQEAIDIVHNSVFWLNDDNSETFEINGYRISQTVDGLVRISRSSNKCIIRTSPSNGSATITTPFVHITASLGQTAHLFVRRGERRIHFDGATFIARNQGHSAGFNSCDKLSVY